MNNHDILPEVEAFLAEYGLSASAFGEMYSGNRAFVKKINSRPIRRDTVFRLRHFMAFLAAELEYDRSHP
jgi:hypothetical protein